MEKENPPPYSPPLQGPATPYPGPGFQYVQQQGQQPSQTLGFSVPYPQQHTMPAHTVVIAPVETFGPRSKTFMCPSCHHNISTEVRTEPNSRTHLFALLLCLFGCIPCCIIPYCTESCQSQQHYCPNCGAYLGSYSN